ncbi:hypothetical protein BOX15_Mlig009163g2, partial [Macrostomum lignano]
SMPAVPRSEVLSLYKQLLRCGQKFNLYNFRVYAREKVRHEFRRNKEVSDPAQVRSLLDEARRGLELLRRQTAINQMFSTQRLVIEQGLKQF